LRLELRVCENVDHGLMEGCAPELFPGAVHANEPPIRREDADGKRRLLHQSAEPALRNPECFFGATALGELGLRELVQASIVDRHCGAARELERELLIGGAVASIG